MSEQEIESALASFRTWLTEMPDAGAIDLPADLPPIDLLTIVEQFTALRQEVNLLTKATRSSNELSQQIQEQYQQACAWIGQRPERSYPPPAEVAKPLLKCLVDIYDYLELSLTQVVRQRHQFDEAFEQMQALLEIDIPEIPQLPVGSSVGLRRTSTKAPWWAFWASKSPATTADEETFTESGDPTDAIQEWREELASQFAQMREELLTQNQQTIGGLDGLITGYQMSLNRIDRILADVGMEILPTDGEIFDPQYMEVVETVSDPDEQPNTVCETVRRGYRWQGGLFRYAQVKVVRAVN